MPNIISLLAHTSSFTTLIHALTAAGMVDTLGGSGPFTLFAPTDDAFQRLPTDGVAHLLTRPARETLTRVLTAHVVAGTVVLADLTDGQGLTTIDGQRLTVHITNPIRVNGVAVVAVMSASNGFIYAVDGLLVPVALPPAA